jgi:hypothetical protein
MENMACCFSVSIRTLPGKPASLLLKNSLVSIAMKINHVLGLVAVMILGLTFNFQSSGYGDDTAAAKAMDQVHALLHQAWGESADTPPTNSERITLLTQAQTLLKKAPSSPAHFRRYRADALQDIASALAELKKGDPDKKAADYIHAADEEIRNLF